MLDHARVVGEVLELGVVALHPVELALVLVQTHRHVVLPVVQNHARQVVHHGLRLLLRLTRQRRPVQRHHERLRLTHSHRPYVVQRTQLLLLHVVRRVHEAHRKHIGVAAEHVAAAEGAGAARREETARVVRLHREQQQSRQVVVLRDLHRLVVLHA